MHERRVPVKAPLDPLDEITLREARALLVEELQRLPERFRQPLVLCYWEGATQDEAAAQLGWSRRTLQRRLERGRRLLEVRLARRGLMLSALPVMLLARGTSSATPSAALAKTTAQAALRFTSGVAAEAGSGS